MNVVSSDEDDGNEEADMNYERSSPLLLAARSRDGHTVRTAVHSLQTATSTSDPISTNYTEGKRFPWSAEQLCVYYVKDLDTSKRRRTMHPSRN